MKVRYLFFALLLSLTSAPAWANSGQAAPLPNTTPNQSLRLPKNMSRNGLWKMVIHRQFKELAQSHQTIALLPVTVTIDKDAKHHSPEQQLAYRAAIEARNFYPVLFAFLQKANKAHADKLRFQDIATTQDLLQAQGLRQQDLAQLAPAQIAALLGVDAVIFCSIRRDEMLVGEASLFQNLKRMSGLAGPSAGTAQVQLYDGKTNVALWQFEGLLTFSLGKNIPQTINSLGNMVASHLPYF